MTFNEQESQRSKLIQSGHSKTPCPGTKKTGEKSTSTYRAKMGCAILPSGLSAWTEGRWLGILRMTRQGTSPSSPTSTPQKNTTMTTTMTPLGPYPHGSYPLSEGAVLLLPHSVKNSTSSPSTTGVSWPKSIGIAPWMSSVSCSAVKLTSSSRSSRWLTWNAGLTKEGLKLPGPTIKSATYDWGKQELERSKITLGQTWCTKTAKPAMDMGVHSDEERGVTDLGRVQPL